MVAPASGTFLFPYLEYSFFLFLIFYLYERETEIVRELMRGGKGESGLPTEQGAPMGSGPEPEEDA